MAKKLKTDQETNEAAEGVLSGMIRDQMSLMKSATVEGAANIVDGFVGKFAGDLLRAFLFSDDEPEETPKKKKAAAEEPEKEKRDTPKSESAKEKSERTSAPATGPTKASTVVVHATTATITNNNASKETKEVEKTAAAVEKIVKETATETTSTAEKIVEAISSNETSTIEKLSSTEVSSKVESAATPVSTQTPEANDAVAESATIVSESVTNVGTVITETNDQNNEEVVSKLDRIEKNTDVLANYFKKMPNPEEAEFERKVEAKKKAKQGIGMNQPNAGHGNLFESILQGVLSGNLISSLIGGIKNIAIAGLVGLTTMVGIGLKKVFSTIASVIGKGIKSLIGGIKSIGTSILKNIPKLILRSFALVGAAFVGFEIGQFINKQIAGTKIREVIDSVLDSVFSAVDGIIEFFTGKSNVLTEGISLSELADGLLTRLGDLVDWVGSLFSAENFSAITEIIGETISTVGTNIANWFDETFTLENFKKIGTSVFESIDSLSNGLLSDIADWFKPVREFTERLSKRVSNLISGVVDIAESIGKWIDSKTAPGTWVGSVVQWFKSEETVSTVKTETLKTPTIDFAPSDLDANAVSTPMGPVSTHSNVEPTPIQPRRDGVVEKPKPKITPLRQGDIAKGISVVRLSKGNHDHSQLVERFKHDNTIYDRVYQVNDQLTYASTPVIFNREVSPYKNIWIEPANSFSEIVANSPYSEISGDKSVQFLTSQTINKPAVVEASSSTEVAMPQQEQTAPAVQPMGGSFQGNQIDTLSTESQKLGAAATAATGNTTVVNNINNQGSSSSPERREVLNYNSSNRDNTFRRLTDKLYSFAYI